MNESYIQRIRKKLGTDRVISPAARIILENETGDFLFIVRKDNGDWGIPAGGFEENETILECIKREVKEEVNVDLHSAHLIGLSSSPSRETVQYPNGDVTQYFTAVFYSKDWSGEAAADNVEVQDIRFAGLEMIHLLPKNERSSFDFLRRWMDNGEVILE